MKKNQHKNDKTSTALVVYQKSAAKQKQNNSRKKKKNRSPNLGGGNYKSALLEPFAVTAQGARVPDMYSVPTTTRHITKSFTVNANASGEFDVIVLPSAYHHAISPRGNLASGATWSLLDNTTVASGLQYTSPAVLGGQLTNYRIVGYGVRVFSTSSMTGTQGRVLIGTTPVSSWINDKTAFVGGQSTNATNTNGTRANTLNAWGIPQTSGVVDIPSLPSLPNNLETSAVRLAERPLYVIPKITSPEAFAFKQSNDSAIGFNITDQTSTTFVTSGDASYMRLAGHELVVLAGTGFAASATGCLEIEVVYHLEGNPFQSTTSFGIIGSDSAATDVNPTKWMSIIQQVARAPGFRDMVEIGGNSFFPGLGTIATKLF
jgi:hypothetical protein